jgi:hypothetical protein
MYCTKSANIGITLFHYIYFVGIVKKKNLARDKKYIRN